MKRNIFLWGGVVCILAALLSSCTKESGILDKPLEADQSYFATVNIVGTDAMTRADEPEFEEGEAYESIVNTIYLVFYDKKGNRISTTQVRSDKGEKLEDQTTSVNSIYKGVIQVDVKHGSLPPAYVTAFINPISSQNFDINPDFATLKSVAKTTRPMIISKGDFSFAMSKSVYYGDDPVTKEKDVKISATPLVVEDEDEDGYAKQLFPSAEAALEALESYKRGDGDKSPVVNIYVERYAAKVQFSLSEKAKSPKFEIKEGDKVTATLTFVPEYWAVNAYESNTYIIKSFLRESAMEQDGDSADEDNTTDRKDDLKFAELNIALGGTATSAPWYWNSKTNHRCYWAQTPAYYAKQYPRVADDILDKPNATILSGYYALGYYSYEEMVDNADKLINAKARSFEGGKNGLEEMPIYARENTVAGSALIAAFEDPSESPKAAIPSVVMVGHYLLDDQPVKDYFYVMGNETNGYTLFKNYEEALKYLMKVTIRFQNGRNQFLFDPDSNQFVPTVWNDKYASYFTIKHPNMVARGSDGLGGGLVIDSRFVTIQLKSLQETDTKYQLDWDDSDVEPLYALINGEYVRVTNENVGQINQQMLYAAGTLQGFEGGKAYFTIPIKHLGFNRGNNANEGLNANDKDFDWTKVQSGDFGLVRNHAYNILVTDIKGLGNGIPDPNDPIVPPTDPEEYFIGARILVLNWAVVPTQDVVL